MRCGAPWAVDARHAQVTCPGCGKKQERRTRLPLWEGDAPLEAREAVARLRQGARALPNVPRMARHDSPADAAAAQARTIVSVGRRAEATATWFARVHGTMSHDELVAALEKAGIPTDRAGKEIVRMLATDILTEPRAGRYALVPA